MNDVKREATRTLSKMEAALETGISDQHELAWTKALRSAELTILSLIAGLEDLARHAEHSQDGCACTHFSDPVVLKTVRRSKDGRIAAVEEGPPHRKLEVGFHR